MTPEQGWTGRTARDLQTALRHSNEAFAAHLGIAVRTVASWHKEPDIRPRPETQQILDLALERAPESARARFVSLACGQSRPQAAELGGDQGADHRLSADPHIGAALDRLDADAGWEPGTARSEVARRMSRLDLRDLDDRASRRRRVGQRQTADALATYYLAPGIGDVRHGAYRARIGESKEIVTSILTQPVWLDLACPLAGSSDGLRLTRAGTNDPPLDDQAAGAAAQRLAETLTSGTRLVDMPLYRLLTISPSPGAIDGALGIAQFARYALTLDLLEGELTDALAAGCETTPGALPLRDRYLPNLATVLDISHRLCAGGPLALSAFARPANPHRGPADYVLIVQERSSQVINAARRLAVIPKAFHQPMTDYQSDARIGATLRREMEEELFGREDADCTILPGKFADPMHPARLSAPMRWLMANSGSFRIECTGFGLNMISGTYEFASLIVIESEEFWSQYGGIIEANWESHSLRQYSSLEGESLIDLTADPGWSNEGLFAFTQGLRRLSQIGGDRASIPSVTWEAAA
jgi:hypothetical protein